MNLVKFREILDWGDDRPTEYGPAYVDIDSVQYIAPHSDGDPKHCTVTFNGSWAVGLDVDIDHMAALVDGTALVYKKDREAEIKEVLQTLEKLYNDFTMRPDECKALDFAINFIKEKSNGHYMC